MRTETQQIAKQLGRGFLGLVISVAIVVLLNSGQHARIPSLGRLAVGALAIAIAYVASSVWVERRGPPELNGSGGAAEFGTGISIGIGLFTVVMVVLWLMRVYRPLGWGTIAGLGSGALLALSEAVIEEIVVRAYLFRLLSLAVGTWAAVLVTSAIFGAAHAANPGATLFSSIAIAFEAGVILAGAYALTRRLWMPIGLHMGWNLAEGTLWGMSVSGGAATAGLSRGDLSGPRILTGGTFGPEASVVAVVLCFTVGVILLRRTVQLRRIQPPMWKVAAESTLPTDVSTSSS